MLIRVKDAGRRRRFAVIRQPLGQWEESRATAEKELARLLLTRLYNHGSSKYVSLINLPILRGFGPSEVDRVSESLFLAGWLRKEEKLRKPVSWETERLELTDGSQDDIAKHYGLLPDTTNMVGQLELFLRDYASEDGLGLEILNLLREQHALLSTAKAASPCIMDYAKATPVACLIRSAERYAVLLKALMEVARVIRAGERIPLRLLSVRIKGYSKALDGLRDDLVRILGDLSVYGIIGHAVELRFWGDFRYAVDGYEADARAGHPSVCLSTESLETFEIVSSSVTGALLVENKTAFEDILRRGLFDRQEQTVVYIGGYMYC